MTLGHALDHAAGRNPGGIALICGGSSVSWAGLDQRATRLAGWFMREGLQPGDRVVFHGPNSIETVVFFFACWRAGLIAVPINPRLKAPELAHVLDHSGASIVFAPPELDATARQALQIAGLNLPLHARLPEPAADEPGALPRVDESDLGAILYTSGTMAQPKGVTHTHQSLLAGAGFMQGWSVAAPRCRS